MNFSRREFLVMWMRPQKLAPVMTVEVLEVFQSRTGPCALLVHQSAPELRQDFSAWLHRFDGAQIELRTPDGAGAAGRIFRVKMCFGRGLVLMSSAANVSTKDKLRIELP
jgi:hypothetical protein